MKWIDTLTVNMLNYKRHIHILNRILDLAWPKWMKLTLERQFMSSVLQYHACWCSGDFRSQGISRHGINQINWNIASPASEELVLRCHLKCVLLIKKKKQKNYSNALWVILLVVSLANLRPQQLIKHATKQSLKLFITQPLWTGVDQLAPFPPTKIWFSKMTLYGILLYPT